MDPFTVPNRRLATLCNGGLASTVSLSVLVFLLPPKCPHKLCPQHGRAFLVLGTKLFYIPATKQFQRLKNHVILFIQQNPES